MPEPLTLSKQERKEKKFYHQLVKNLLLKESNLISRHGCDCLRRTSFPLEHVAVVFLPDIPHHTRRRGHMFARVLILSQTKVSPPPVLDVSQ